MDASRTATPGALAAAGLLGTALGTVLAIRIGWHWRCCCLYR